MPPLPPLPPPWLGLPARLPARLAVGLALLALLGPLGLPGAAAARGSLHCAERRDISPCTCSPMSRGRTIEVVCERMTSFGQVVTALRGRFKPDVHIALSISFSELQDFPERGFDELGLAVSKLTLRGNKLSQLPEEAFAGLNGTRYFSLADNALPAVPASVLALMPKVQVLDISNSRLTTVRAQDLKALATLQYLVLVGNTITTLERDSFPRTMRNIHLGSNQLRQLNGTLRELLDLHWLFLDFNQLTTLDGELPERGLEQLALVFVANNRLERLPAELRLCPRLETMLASNNSIVSLDGIFSRARRLQLLELGNNKIKALAEDDFLEAENMELLHLGHNEIESLNLALQNARALVHLNLTHNKLAEFSLLEIHGLQRLKMVDLSHNRIARLGGRMENVVDSETRVEELRLEYNELVSLDGALVGVQGLERLNLSHNLLASISPDDLIGLDQLKTLDVSYNRLRTLEETSKTFMPQLEELMASHNLLEVLERDFHGLPVLCRADLSSNNISRIHPELTSKTRCKVHGVNGVLRITLHDNPVRCDEELARTLLVFQSNLTELQGVPACALTVPHMLLLSVPVGSLNGVPVQLPVQVPVQVPVQGAVPVLPAIYTGVSVPGVVGVPAGQTVVLGGYPLTQLQPLAAAVPAGLVSTAPSTTSTTTTTTTTTTPAPPEPTTTEVLETTPAATTTPAALPPTAVATTEATTLVISTTPTTTTTTPPPPTTTVAVPERERRQDEEPNVGRAEEKVVAPVAVPVAVPREGEQLLVPISDQDEQAVPVLKELPPVIQLLKPEVSVQQSKDMPRLVDPELMVLANAPLPPPPLPAPGTLSSPAPPQPQPPEQPLESRPGGPGAAGHDEMQAEAPDPDEVQAEAGAPEPVEPPDSTTPPAPADLPPEPMAADGPPDAEAEVSELPPLILIKLLNEAPPLAGPADA